MRAFVTGASGFIGGHLTSRLLRDGYQVRAFVHRTPLQAAGPLESIRGDIRDFDLLKDALRDVDVLFHLASALGASRIGAGEFLAINAGGTRAVFRAAAEAGVKKIIHFSSAGVLGHVSRGEVAGEDHPLDPRDAYDRSKLEGEKIALEWARQGRDIIVIRPGWVYGPGDRRTFKLFRAIARRRFVRAGRGNAPQTPVFIDDLIEGALLCGAKGASGEVYNLAGPEVLTVKAITEIIAAALGTKIPRLGLPLAPTRAAAWGLGKVFSIAGEEAPLTPSRLAFFVHPKPLSIKKAAADLGYVPAWDFRRGAAAAVAWYRANGWLP
jgi:nucleoside-diphosphate-sugar epimerase